VEALKKELPKLKEYGKSLLDRLIEGAKSVFGDLAKTGQDIFNTVYDALKGLPDKLKELGKQLLEGLWNGIKDSMEWIYKKLEGLGDGITKKLKKAFGISSPSKVWRDEVGYWLARGLGVGFTEEMDQVSKEMQDAIPTLDVEEPNFEIGSSSYGTGGLTSNYETMVAAFKEALEGVNVELDDQKVGKFVTKTVTRAIYT
jgi:hypothetical protein